MAFTRDRLGQWLDCYRPLHLHAEVIRSWATVFAALETRYDPTIIVIDQTRIILQFACHLKYTVLTGIDNSTRVYETKCRFKEDASNRSRNILIVLNCF